MRLTPTIRHPVVVSGVLAINTSTYNMILSHHINLLVYSERKPLK